MDIIGVFILYNIYLQKQAAFKKDVLIALPETIFYFTDISQEHNRSKRMSLMTGMSSRTTASSSNPTLKARGESSSVAGATTASRPVPPLMSQQSHTLYSAPEPNTILEKTATDIPFKEVKEDNHSNSSVVRGKGSLAWYQLSPGPVHSWTMFNNIPAVVESIRVPINSLTTSFYSYMYTPKTTVHTPVRTPARLARTLQHNDSAISIDLG